jgi:hypothetical protein
MVTFNVRDDSAVIGLVDESGASISGTSAWDGDTLVFTPDLDLASGDTHTATVEWCEGEATFSWLFTPSSFGLPLEVDPTGYTYILDLSTGSVEEPAGLGDLLFEFLSGELLLGVGEASSELLLEGGYADSTGSQDMCFASQPFPAADFSTTPSFVTPGVEVAVPGFDSGTGDVLPIEDLQLYGVFSADGETLGLSQIVGEMDARSAGAALEGLLGTSDPRDLCSFLEAFGAACQACTSDGESYCVPIEIEDVYATRVSGTVEPIEESDCHPDCAASYSNPDCDTSGW